MDEIIESGTYTDINFKIDGLNFLGNLEIGLYKCGTFSVKITFTDLPIEDYKHLKYLETTPVFTFHCDDLKKDGYNITQLTIEKSYCLGDIIIWKAISGGQYIINIEKL